MRTSRRRRETVLLIMETGMKRFHVHLHVHNVEESVKFYTTLFGAQPTKHKPDYAKWMLDNPYVNFAISKVEGHVGLSHLGIQVGDEEALTEVFDRARDATGDLLVERRGHCGYAVGNKSWVNDPQGVRWENFHTYNNEMETFGCGAAEAWDENRTGEKRLLASPSCSSAKQTSKTAANISN
jgi:catechol 2,3-dioxygenase-like lactoylglutathione lyase family enzyme